MIYAAVIVALIAGVPEVRQVMVCRDRECETVCTLLERVDDSARGQLVIYCAEEVFLGGFED